MSFIPPCFSDVGKKCSDLLSKDYPTGVTKLELNTTTPNGLKFTVNLAKDNKLGFIASDVKAKYTDQSSGIVFTETWNTNNVLGIQVEMDDCCAKGLKIDLNGNVQTEKSIKSVKAQIEYKKENVNLRSSLDVFKVLILYKYRVLPSSVIL
jgi:voltage-dependent anion channel protein 2